MSERQPDGPRLAETPEACPRCGSQLAAAGGTCATCGFIVSASTPRVDLEDEPDAPAPEGWLACPGCGTLVFPGDPAYATCGLALCARCGAGIDEDDEACPSCGLAVTFTCPECGLNLLSGAEVCPIAGLSVSGVAPRAARRRTTSLRGARRATGRWPTSAETQRATRAATRTVRSSRGLGARRASAGSFPKRGLARGVAVASARAADWCYW